MKHLLKLLMVATLAGIYSCERAADSPEDPQPIAKCNVVEITENISTPQTWKEGHVYVIKNKSISVNNTTLTIEPGVVVKLQNGRLNVYNGRVLAQGTAQKRIVFTSLADDRYCGDTNGDGTASQPQKGDWQSMVFGSGQNGSIFKYADFFYAGQNLGGYNNAVKIDVTGAFEFDNCRFAHTLFNPAASYESSTAFHGGSRMSSADTHKFTNNAFYDNGKPLYVWTHYTVNPNNKFHNPENPQQKNSHNGIAMIRGSGGLDASVQWHVTEVPYILDEYVQVHGSQVIDIGFNTVVKFKRTGAGISRHAPSNVVLHSSAILTSYKDDSVGGDTNGDGTSTTAVKGDWLGMYNVFTGNQHYQASANIRYAKHP